MKTRFDGTVWVTGFGVAFDIKEMETSHLLNTVKMLVQKPARVVAMLVSDIEKASFETNVWTTGKVEDSRKQSLRNVTGLSGEELVKYVVGTPLFTAMLEELDARGVNTENIMELYLKDPSFQQ